MNARIEAFQLAATPAIASLTKPWLQKLYALNNPTVSVDVTDDVLQDLLMQCRLELSAFSAVTTSSSCSTACFSAAMHPTSFTVSPRTSVMTWALKLTKPSNPACGQCWSDFFR